MRVRSTSCRVEGCHTADDEPECTTDMKVSDSAASTRGDGRSPSSARSASPFSRTLPSWHTKVQSLRSHEFAQVEMDNEALHVLLLQGAQM